METDDAGRKTTGDEEPVAQIQLVLHYPSDQFIVPACLLSPWHSSQILHDEPWCDYDSLAK